MKRKFDGGGENTIISKKSRRRTIYETAKTVVICLLCVSTVYMTFRLVDMHGNSETFLPVGGDPASVMSSELTTENILENYLDFSEPELVIINKGENRGELKKNRVGYERIMDFTNKVMQSIHSSNAVYSRVSSDAVLKALMMANTVYIKYPYIRAAEMDAQFFQIKDSAFAENAVVYSKLFLLPDTTSGKVVVYIISEENPGELLKIQTESFAATLQELINNLDYIDKKEYAFAAELNLDSAEKENGESNLPVLDPMIPIPLSGTTASTAVAEIPWEYANTLNFTQATDYSAGLMEIFSYNPNTIRQYVDKNDVLTFVSQKGTLSMDAGGVLQYKALDRGEGVVFATGNSSNIYSSTAGVIKTVKRIMSLCYTSVADENSDIRFTEITREAENVLSFKLDYFINGHKVKLNRGSAIEVKVHDGVMTELKMHINSFKVLGKNFENKTLISAIDEMYAGGEMGRNIKSAHLVYEYTGVGKEMNTKWEIDAGQKE